MGLGQLPASDYNQVQRQAGSELEPGLDLAVEKVDVHLGPIRLGLVLRTGI